MAVKTPKLHLRRSAFMCFVWFLLNQLWHFETKPASFLSNRSNGLLWGSFTSRHRGAARDLRLSPLLLPLSGGDLTVRLAQRISHTEMKRPDSLFANVRQRQEVVSMAAHAFMQRHMPQLFQPRLKSRHFWKSVCFRWFATVWSHGRLGRSDLQTLSTKGLMISLCSTRNWTDYINSRSAMSMTEEPSEPKIMRLLLQAIWIKHSDLIMIIKYLRRKQRLHSDCKLKWLKTDFVTGSMFLRRTNWLFQLFEVYYCMTGKPTKTVSMKKTTCLQIQKVRGGCWATCAAFMCKQTLYIVGSKSSKWMYQFWKWPW